jgi:hypothetical protein
VREYDSYVPLNYNDGSPIEAAKIDEIGTSLLNEFGGYTFFPQPKKGAWKMGRVVFRDDIAIYRVHASDVRAARRFLRRLKEELKKSLRQEEILIVEKEAQTL